MRPSHHRGILPPRVSELQSFSATCPEAVPVRSAHTFRGARRLIRQGGHFRLLAVRPAQAGLILGAVLTKAPPLAWLNRLFASKIGIDRVGQ